GEIFRSDITGDGTVGDLVGLIGGTGKYSTSKLNDLIAFYNHNLAGQLTPAGSILALNGLFTVDQLKSLGAVAPLICSSIHTGRQDCQGLPGHYAQATWLKTIDLRLSWPLRVGE